MRQILPDKKSIFIDRDVHTAILNAIDTTAEGIKNIFEIDIPFIRPFLLQDSDYSYFLEVHYSVSSSGDYFL